MAIDDKQAKNEARNLEGMLERGDSTSLHNRLLHDSRVVDKDSFNKIVKCFDEQNREARQSVSSLPSLEIHNDFFGIGSTDQIVTRGSNGKKMEVFESDKHRQDEVEKNSQQSNPYEMDLARNLSKFASSEWVDNKTDFHTDSSVPWIPELATASPGSVVDHRNGNEVGSYDYGDSVRRVNSDQDLQQILNNPPAGYGGAYRR